MACQIGAEHSSCSWLLGCHGSWEAQVRAGVQIAGGVTMNNTMCLGLFLLVVWYKGLEWTYTSEVIATVGERCPLHQLQRMHMPAQHVGAAWPRVAGRLGTRESRQALALELLLQGQLELLHLFPCSTC